MYSIERDPKRASRLAAAFGAGALCALILPKAFFCILGMGLLLGTAYVLSKH
ncbi:MAG: hypothetical protein IKM08_08965 [Clostridia bacterium]|nr:hypothetical protein [Clostridia bacterium]